MRKRIIAIFVGIILAVSSLCVSAEGTQTVNPRETAAIGTVMDLGLITLNDYSADVTIQRRDLAEVVVKTMGEGEQKYTAVFNDVEKNDNKSNYINGAYSLGILKGYFDGGFHPFSTVTCNEALKTLVVMAGYETYAEYKGGYPYGYVMVAKQLKISSGISLNGNEPVTLGKFCVMLLKTLEVNKLDSIAVSGGELTLSSDEGRSILTDNLDLKILEGTVTANYMTELTGPSTLERDQIKINGEIYTTALEKLTRQLGKRFIFYISGENTVVTYREKNLNKEDIYIVSDDILAITDGKITYTDENGRKNSANISDNADFIYNGRAKISWSESDIPLINSEIRMVDTDADGTADVIFVNAYKNLIVKQYVEEDGIINLKTTEPEWRTVSISEEDDIVYELLDADGNVVDPAELKEWNILSVAKSLDGKVVVMRVGTQTADGACTATGEDGITIGENTYAIDKAMDTGVINGNIVMGKEGTFYLDYVGRVAAVSYAAMPLKNYAYLIRLADSGKTLSEDVFVEVYDYDGEVKIYELAEKVKINGVRSKAEDILTDNKFIRNGKVVNQLITYEKNSAGEIKSIFSADDASLYSDAEREMNFTVKEFSSDVTYRMGNMNMFASRYFITDNTFIFVVPDDASDTDNYNIIKRSNLIGDKGYSGVKLYDIDQNRKVAAAILKYEDDLFEQNVATIGAVLKVRMGHDEEGNDTVNLTVRSGSNPIELKMRDDMGVRVEWNAIIDYDNEAVDFIDWTTNGVKYISPEKLQVGDIVQYVNDPKGKLSAMYLVYRRGTETIAEVMGSGQATKDNAYATKYVAHTTIKKILDKAILVEVPSSDGTEMYERAFPFLDGTVFLKYDKDTKSVEQYSVNRLQEGDEVFFYFQATNAKLVVVY